MGGFSPLYSKNLRKWGKGRKATDRCLTLGGKIRYAGSEVRRMAAIHSNLRGLRQRRGLTQEAVARKMGLARQAVSSHESGRTQPDLNTLLRYAEVYGVSAQEILYGSGRGEARERQLRRLALAAWLTLTLGALLQSGLLWAANQFLAVPEGVLDAAARETLARRMDLLRFQQGIETTVLVLFGLLSLLLLAAALRMERPLPGLRRWRYLALLAGGAAGAALPWAVTDPLFGVANYTVTPTEQLLWAAILVLVSLAGDGYRLGRKKQPGRN